MIVYRICASKYATRLTASGSAARWNFKGRFVLYTSQSKALACLENVVHRSGEGLNAFFKTMLIEIPDQVTMTSIEPHKLNPGWESFDFAYCQQTGEAWLEKGDTLILKVPSVIIPGEFNYLINTNHPKIHTVKLIHTEDFIFDPRIKGS